MAGRLRLHHCSKRISQDSLEFVMALFEKLGCRQSFWADGARWAMIEQQGRDSIVQFIETDQPSQSTKEKRNSHIAFLSPDPRTDISEIAHWIAGQNRKVLTGQWSDREFYLDCPDVFIDFVIEIMDDKIVEST